MDHALFHLINREWTSPALDLFMAAMSDVNVWLPLLVGLMLYALIFGGFKGRAFVFCVGLTLLLSEAVVVQNLKPTVGRLRPKQAETVRLVQLARSSPKFLAVLKRPEVHDSEEWDRRAPGGGNSFPSAHVANNFVIGTYCVLFFGRRGLFYLPVALIISYSRAYLGAHWPSDIAATAFLGIGEALLMATALAALWRRVGKRLVPQTFARHPHLIENLARL